ncbi:thioesterase [Heliobacterium gestii]|uniref:Thioesterase n=1 Tax=Heliomicrobium gestii TaxID=2699 RepID=A0A845L993_HELGE|nr:thioesterase family protein [Heliomicrobium gestii]MBM7866438.1 putative thioesterase [Heliomicrobium gestii]MZP42778.1 thioesterase [Heliomicrobium gestii]
MDNITVGLKGSKEEKVTADNTAIRYGSGGVEVYATPAMIGLMEGAALAAVDPRLPDGMATVGTHIAASHLAATPVGMTVRAEAELTEVDGKKLVFAVVAYDDAEKIGEGVHHRFVIQTERFLARQAAKAKR